MDPETAEKIKQLVGSKVLEKLDSSYDSHGCISQGKSYNTDKGRVFIKSNSSPHVIFVVEFAFTFHHMKRYYLDYFQ